MLRVVTTNIPLNKELNAIKRKGIDTKAKMIIQPRRFIGYNLASTRPHFNGRSPATVARVLR